jgi:hypothetical protein
MTKKKKTYTTGDDFLTDETLELFDENMDISEYVDDPRFDANDYEYLQEVHGDGIQSKDVQFISTDRYFKRLRKGE